MNGKEGKETPFSIKGGRPLLLNREFGSRKRDLPPFYYSWRSSILKKFWKNFLLAFGYTQQQKSKFRYQLESGRSSYVSFNDMKDRNQPLAELWISANFYSDPNHLQTFRS